MAEMVRRAEGGKRSFARILEDDLFRPLGMRETSLGPRDDLVPRLCPVAARFTEPGLFGPREVDGIGALFSLPGAEIPAGGYLTTLADLARFVEMLQRGGELDGARILSPAMIEFATRNHTATSRTRSSTTRCRCAAGSRSRRRSGPGSSSVVRESSRASSATCPARR